MLFLKMSNASAPKLHVLTLEIVLEILARSGSLTRHCNAPDIDHIFLAFFESSDSPCTLHVFRNILVIAVIPPIPQKTNNFVASASAYTKQTGLVQHSS